MRACAKCKIDGEKATRYYSGGMEGRKEKKKFVHIEYNSDGRGNGK